MWLSLAGVANALDAAGLVVETGSPDAFCPDLRQTREAVERRLGSLEVDGRRGWRARYTIGHAPEGSPRDIVRLELFNPQGALDLARDLPLRGESCSTMAEVIALVLDRHFRSFTIEERAATKPGSSASAEPFVQPTPTPRPVTRAVDSPEAPLASASIAYGSLTTASAHDTKNETSAPLSGRALLLAGEFAETTQGGRQALGVRAVGGLGNNLHVGSVVLFDLGRETEVLPLGGRVSAKSSQLRAFLGWGRAFGPLFAYVGPGVGLCLQRGEARELPRNRELLRASWAAGIESGFAVLIDRRFLVQTTAALAFELRPLSGKFYVEEQEVLKTAAIQAWVGLGAGYAFYP
jgi:hypothetical protein